VATVTIYHDHRDAGRPSPGTAAPPGWERERYVVRSERRREHSPRGWVAVYRVWRVGQRPRHDGAHPERRQKSTSVALADRHARSGGTRRDPAGRV
jgi:hypothetical protein